MTKHVPLSSIDHRQLRIDTSRDEKFGDRVMFAVTVPHEFRDVQTHYPIFFQRNPNTGQFLAVAMFGFEQGENLFLDTPGWKARYLPLSMQINPFLIGRPANENAEPTIHFDADNPRVGAPDGMRLFDDQGMTTPFLDDMANKLGRLHAGYQSSTVFMETLQDLDLLEPFSLDIELKDGTKNRLVGFHTIHEERFRALGPEVVGELHAKDMLMPIFMAMASLSNIGTLVDFKNETLTHV